MTLLKANDMLASIHYTTQAKYFSWFLDDSRTLMMRYVPVIILLLVALPAFSQEPAPRAAIPDEAAQKAASAIIVDVYKPDYEKARTPAQKIELAKKLLGEGVATKDDPVSRYVLFRVARDVAAQQGDLVTAFDAIGRIGQEFAADQLGMKVDSATAVVKALKLAKDHQACAALLTPLIDEAIAVDRYEHAKSLATLTLGCARDGRDADLTKQVVAKLKEVEEIAAEFENVAEAKVALEAKPTDPDANFAVGKFLCMIKGDWKRGITMLALANNEEFKATALIELEAEPDSLKLGDAWWKISEGLDKTAKSRTQTHAVEWYRKALPRLSGLTKSRVERLVAQVEVRPEFNGRNDVVEGTSEQKPAKNGPKRLSEIQYLLNGSLVRHPVTYEGDRIMVTRVDGTKTQLQSQGPVLFWQTTIGTRFEVNSATNKTSNGETVRFIFDEQKPVD